jgi:transposase-like protein
VESSRIKVDNLQKEIIRQITEIGCSIDEVSTSSGISQETLYKWVRESLIELRDLE